MHTYIRVMTHCHFRLLLLNKYGSILHMKYNKYGSVLHMKDYLIESYRQTVMANALCYSMWKEQYLKPLGFVLVNEPFRVKQNSGVRSS